MADDARAAVERGRRDGDSADGDRRVAAAAAGGAGIFLGLRGVCGGGSARGGKARVPQGLISRRAIAKKTLRSKISDHIFRRIYSWHLSCAPASMERTTHGSIE